MGTRNWTLRISYVCAAIAAGLVGLHFNAERLAGWTPTLAWMAAILALAGTVLAAMWLSTRGWTRRSSWSGQLAFATNALLGLGFFVYAIP